MASGLKSREQGLGVVRCAVWGFGRFWLFYDHWHGLKLRAWRTVAAKILFALSLAALSEQAKEGTAPNDVQSRPAAYVLSWPIPLQWASTMTSVQSAPLAATLNPKPSSLLKVWDRQKRRGTGAHRLL